MSTPDTLDLIEKTARALAVEYRQQAYRAALRIGAETHAQESAANDLDHIADRLAALPKQGLLDIDKARLVLWQAIGAIEIGNKTDDKLILENLRKAGYWIAALPPPPEGET